MKKLLSLSLAVIMLLAICVTGAGATYYPDNHQQLGDLFQDGYVNGNKNDDFAFFESTEAAESGKKYPLIVWLHGRSSGFEPRQQVYAHNIVNWASEEYQSRFSDGGAYILLPRSKAPDNSWYDYMCAHLKETIDYFIEQHKDTIDTSRISIFGLSAGGTMVYSMLIAYPDFFAAAVPMSAIALPTFASMSNWKDLSIWMVVSDNDYYPSANTLAATPTFEYMRSITNRPEGVRMTNLSQVVYADGTHDKTERKMQHLVWDTVCFDMHMADGSPYMYQTTKDAAGNRFTFEDTDGGMIEWLSEQRRPQVEVKKTFFDRIVDFFNSIISFFMNLFNRI